MGFFRMKKKRATMVFFLLSYKKNSELVVIRIRFILLPESLLSKRQEMNHENAWRIGETWLLPKSSS
jgi:hypothetical protein